MKGYNDITPTMYELFVQEFHEQLLHQEGFKDIDVRHDVKIKGKSGNYNQIDVFWELSTVGVIQKFCVECKKWKHTVKKSDIGSFISTINDIGGACGIYVTTEGYQTGAIKLAKENNIVLIEAKPIIKKHPARLDLIVPKFFTLNITFKEKHDSSRFERLENYISNLSVLPELCDAMGIQVMNEEELKTFLERENSGFYSFDISGYYIRVGNELFQCDTVSYHYYSNQTHPEFSLDGYSESAEILAKYLSDNREVKKYIKKYNEYVQRTTV
ncbi:restriction endonuclease [Marinomonas shanghaiensis]|uniref:restriction endonuclease n=1 Tax=Marinomonas shanghaiensis TaxID=2202418 RepID=UPI003A912310